MQDKLSFYKSVAEEFTAKTKNFSSVDEIAIFGSVAAGDPYPKDVDVAIFLSSLEEIPKIAKANRQVQSKMQGFDLFVFDISRTFIGNICHRKDCPGMSVDCNREGCGVVKYIEKREGLEVNPKRWFKTPLEILYQSKSESILLNWQKEILKKLNLKKPESYILKKSIFIRCRDCGNQFELDPGEQKYFESMGFYYPKSCQTCRDERKQMEFMEFGD